MTFPFQKTVNNENETGEIAALFAGELIEGDVVALIGTLGSGKTSFVKAAAKEYEINNVSSPSFAIVNNYTGTKNINHFDFYRIKRIDELFDIGFTEYLNEDSITFIEWAEMFSELLPKKYFEVKIDLVDGTKRTIKIRRVT